MPAIQSMLSATAFGERVTIGREPIQELRTLSDARALMCPLCEQCVVLKAGSILAPHFAHLPGAVCSHHDAEPETARHREGKALLARWVRQRLPDSTTTVEAVIAETGQRADLLVVAADGRRVALEYQCADLSGLDWKRRHASYRSAGILDLWILGGTRLVRGERGYRATELERTIASAGLPLLFLDSLGENLPSGHIARLRPRNSQESWIEGGLSARPLDELEFPWRLLVVKQDTTAPPEPPRTEAPVASPREDKPDAVSPSEGDAAVMRWLNLKYGVTFDSLSPLFGMEVRGSDAFGCSAALWQAAVYYRWVHGRVGDPWWLEQVLVWARTRLPMGNQSAKRLQIALADYQDLLAAAGLLTLPQSDGRARIAADLTSLGRPVDPTEAQRLASYRRTLRRTD